MLHCNKRLPRRRRERYHGPFGPEAAWSAGTSKSEYEPLHSPQHPVASTVTGMVRLGEAMNEILRLSPMVVALRTDVALAAMADPASVPAGEPIRMVAEKFDAVAQGAVAATLEASLAVGRGLLGGRLPLDAGFRVATAALAPMRGRLRDNVRRLGAGRLDTAAEPAERDRRPG